MNPRPPRDPTPRFKRSRHLGEKRLGLPGGNPHPSPIVLHNAQTGKTIYHANLEQGIEHLGLLRAELAEAASRQGLKSIDLAN